MGELIAEVVQENAKSTNSSVEGMAIACGSMMLMALLPIIIGAFRSVDVSPLKGQKDAYRAPLSTMTQKHAALCLIIVSTFLSGIYYLKSYVKGLSLFGESSQQSSMQNLISVLETTKSYLDSFNTYYPLPFWVFSLAKLMKPLAIQLMPATTPENFNCFFRDKDPQYVRDIYCFVTCLKLSICVCYWHLHYQHWIVNNLLTIAVTVFIIENFVHLKNVMTGYILLGGLFFCDIFRIYVLDFMDYHMMYLKSNDAPIKLFFPLDLIENGLSASNFAVLGSCNLILLGIFIAVLLRFDNRLMRGTNFYFNVTTAAFALGLVASMLVEHSYHQAQSALLYLAPICLGTPLFMAVCRGDVKAMFSYEDYPAGTSADKKDE